MLYVGFAAVIAVLLAVTAVGLFNLGQAGDGMEQVVNKNDRQVGLMQEMHSAARERSLSLQSMMVIDDPFERDELKLELGHWSAAYANARDQLIRFQLDTEEYALLEEQHAQSRETGRLQNHIADLLVDGEDAEALHLFYYQALPGQNRAMALMEQFIGLKRAQNHAALEAVRGGLDRSYQLMLGLSLFGVLLSIAVAAWVIRKNRGAIEALSEAGESLEDEVLARAKIEQELRESELRERTIRENILDGVVTIDEQGIIGSCNVAGARMFGYEARELVGRNVSILMPEPHRTAHDGYLRDYMQSGNSSIIGAERELQGRRRDGSLFPIELAVSEVWLKNKRIFIGVLRDITEHKQTQERLNSAREELEREVQRRTAELRQSNSQLEREVAERRHAEERLTFLANYDSLTELPNRSMFSVQFNTAIAHARRNDKRVALLFMDLDGFKQVNDTLGHDAGDELLRQACQRMRSTVREEDVVARMGGDEFTLILGDVADRDDAARVAAKVVEAMSPPFIIDGEQCDIGVSIGISLFPDDSDDPDELLRQADDAMYWVKRDGKMGYRYYGDGESAVA